MTDKKPEQDSITKVNFSDYIKSGYFSGDRRTIGFKGDIELYERFKPVAKALYSSVCRAFEAFEAALVYAAEQKVNLSYTSGSPINIEKIVIERNVRSRRRLEVEEEVSEKVELPCCGFCGKPLAVAKFQHVNTGIVKIACDFHTEMLRERSDWVEVAF